jgi:hypothetical protein
LLNGFPTPLSYVRKQDPQYGYGTGLLRCILVARFSTCAQAQRLVSLRCRLLAIVR